jgi:hypothetical protein
MWDSHARIYIAINLAYIDGESAGDLLPVLTYEGTVNAFFYIIYMRDKFKRHPLESEFLSMKIVNIA